MKAMQRVALAVTTLVILGLTLFPVAGAQEISRVSLSVTGLRGVADAIANVLLFVPFGAAAALVLRGWRPVAAGAVLSLCIELVQLWIPGRYTSPFDVVFNTLGTAAGATLVWSAGVWLRPGPRLGRLLAATSLAAGLAILAGGGALFHPSIPPGTLHGQWTAVFGDMARYEGIVSAASVGGLDAPSRRIRESAALRRALLEGELIRVEAEAGPPPAGLAPLFSIFDSDAVEMLLIGVDRHDLVIRYRMRATALRLDEPHFRALDALQGLEPGDPFAVEVWRPGAALCLRVSLPGSSRTRCDFGYTVGDTWALLLFPLPRPLPALMRVVWIGALLLPAGFWMPRAPATAAVAAVLAVIVLAAAPRFVGLLPTPSIQLAAAAAGIAAGYLVGRGVRG
jgi:hypothetical protein